MTVAEQTKAVLVGFCKALQKELGLEDDQVYLWNQKINPPKDERLYIAVSVVRDKVYGNNTKAAAEGEDESAKLTQVQTLHVAVDLDLDLCSRSSEARDRRHEVVMALVSNRMMSRAEQQIPLDETTRLAFAVSSVPTSFLNISEIDGGAIPYRFNGSVVLNYKVSKTSDIDWYDDFSTPEVTTQP